MKKVALITGASKGIGKETAIEFAKKDYNIVITYLTSKDEAFSLKNHIENTYKVKVLVVKVDISDENDVIHMTKKVKESFNNVDVLVNNASYYADNDYLNKTKEEFIRVLEVNTVGNFLVTKYISSIMDGGVIINVSSRDSLDTYNELSMDYCASKAGINSLTQTFSLALPRIKLMSVLLPWVNTDAIKEMNPEYLEKELKRTKQDRLIEPKEVAERIYNYANDINIKSGSLIKAEF